MGNGADAKCIPSLLASTDLLNKSCNGQFATLNAGNTRRSEETPGTKGWSTYTRKRIAYVGELQL